MAVVEDDAQMLKAVGRLLLASGYDVALFESAEVYLTHFERVDVDCLLLDINLNGMSGIDLQKKLCTEGRAPPIIFISGNNDIPSIGQAIDYGCIAYLHKPFEARCLIDAIESTTDIEQ